MPTLPTGRELVADDAHGQGQKQDADEGEDGRRDVAQQWFGVVVTITWDKKKKKKKKKKQWESTRWCASKYSTRKI